MIGITAPNALVSVIDDRRKGLRWSRAQYALAIIEKWEEAGYPAVTESDHWMEVAKKTASKKAASS